MGNRSKEAIFIARNKMNPAPNLLFYNTIVIEGLVAGSWRRTVQKKLVELEYHLYNPTRKKQLHLLQQAIKKFSKFTRLPVEIEMGDGQW